ncbi:MAG: PHP domain-containing protein [Kiritimatiellae bacterium]|nr:PHP domain-containing protein [Kiritimatiellia bacterium]
MIDLHTHSTASDGSLSPTALARAGKMAGLDVMALTDHDCAKGLDEFLAEAARIGLRGVPGIELSAEVTSGQLHLVGLGFDHHDPTLCEAFEKMLGGRDARNQLMLSAFQANGIDLTMDEVAQYAGDELVSRVHFAQALIARGLVSNLSEAFERFLGKGALCYRDRFRYSPAECIRLIQDAGGVVVMAHPLSLERDLQLLERRIAELKAVGLVGMECFYSTYDTETTVALLRMAKRLDLIPSVGSDFHGVPKPDIFLGKLSVSNEVKARLCHLIFN